MNVSPKIISDQSVSSVINFVCFPCRRPAEDLTAGSVDDDSDIPGTDWTELELDEVDDLAGLGDEELPHMLLPDSLSQLEEFGRHKRPRKAHRGHGRPRLFSDLWVRMDR